LQALGEKFEGKKLETSTCTVEQPLGTSEVKPIFKPYTIPPKTIRNLKLTIQQTN